KSLTWTHERALPSASALTHEHDVIDLWRTSRDSSLIFVLICSQRPIEGQRAPTNVRRSNARDTIVDIARVAVKIVDDGLANLFQCDGVCVAIRNDCAAR